MAAGKEKGRTDEAANEQWTHEGIAASGTVHARQLLTGRRRHRAIEIGIGGGIRVVDHRCWRRQGLRWAWHRARLEQRGKLIETLIASDLAIGRTRGVVTADGTRLRRRCRIVETRTVGAVHVEDTLRRVRRPHKA